MNPINFKPWHGLYEVKDGKVIFPEGSKHDNPCVRKMLQARVDALSFELDVIIDGDE